MNQGVVLAYLNVNVPPLRVVPLPWASQYFSTTQSFKVDFLPDVGKLFVYQQFLTAPFTPTPNFFIGTDQFRYILIPGGVAGGRSNEKTAEINGQVYTESELKAMSYAQVCSLLRIAQ